MGIGRTYLILILTLSFLNQLNNYHLKHETFSSQIQAVALMLTQNTRTQNAPMMGMKSKMVISMSQT